MSSTPSLVSADAQQAFDRAGFEAFKAHLAEPAWLTQRRDVAWKQFEQTSWPDRKQEDWMRSDLRGFKLDRFRFPKGSGAVTSSLADHHVPQYLSEGVELAGQLETLDGAIVSEKLSDRWEKKGVLFGDLGRMAVEHPELVERYLFSVVDPRQDRFAALHAASFSGGHFLYVPRGVCVDQPLHVAAGMTDGGTDTGHTLIVIEEGAEATFLYEANSSKDANNGLHLGSVEIIVRPGGNLRYVNLQDWSRGVWHFAHHRATVDRDASIQWTIAAIGSRFSQVSQRVSLVGKGATSQVNGVLFTHESEPFGLQRTSPHLGHRAPAHRSHSSLWQPSQRLQHEPQRAARHREHRPQRRCCVVHSSQVGQRTSRNNDENSVCKSTVNARASSVLCAP